MSQKLIFTLSLIICSLLSISCIPLTEDNSDLFSIDTNSFTINKGESKELTLTINLKTKLDINFENTIIIGVDLDKEDGNFTSKLQSIESTKDKDIYTLTVSSSTIGKNTFTITLYDYENQKIFPLTVVEFTVTKEEEKKELTPDPSQTKLISKPNDTVNENDTVTLEFQLFGKDKKPFEIPKKDLGYLKVYINGKEIKDAEISIGKDNTYTVKVNPEEYGNNQKLNVYYDDGKNKVKLFKNDFEYKLLLYPLYTKTVVNCSNCQTIGIDDKLNMSIYLYNYKGKCVEDGDFSDKFKIEVKGPIEDKSKVETKNYKVKKVKDSKLKCQNKYEIEIEEDNKYEDFGNYEIDVYQDDKEIYHSIQSVVDLYLPDPTKTKLLNHPKEQVKENETITLGLEIYNKNGEVIKLEEKDLDKLKVYINDKEVKDAEIYLTDNGTYIIKINPEEYGTNQKLDIYYDNGKDKIKLTNDDIIYELILTPALSKTVVNCINCDDLNVDDRPLLSIYLYNYKRICVEGGDFSELFNIEINGPYKLNNQKYKVRKALEYNLKCRNKYIILVDKEPFIYEGDYEIKTYQEDDIIYDNNVNVIDNSIPYPENTKIIKGPPSSVDENETISVELKLYDKNRNLLKNKINYLNRLSIYINGKKCEDADISLSEDGKSFIFSFKPDENSRDQKLNFKYDDGKNIIELLPKDFEFKVQSDPFPSNNRIICENCKTIAVGDKLSMFLYVYNIKNICVDREDFSPLFRVVLEGPLYNDKSEVINFYFERDIDPELPCQNKYRLNPLDHKYLFGGVYKILVYQEDELIHEFEQISIVSSDLCDPNNSIIEEADEEETSLGTKIYFSLKCLDVYGNPVKIGGANFTADGNYELNGKFTSFDLEVIDLKNGEYQFGFIPSNSIEYTINIYQNGEFFKDYIINDNCDEEYPILCPNKNKCVKDKYDCLDNHCPRETPFYCKVDGLDTCVESQIECDCPEYYRKCGFMNYCVPSHRDDMCPTHLIIQNNICSNFEKYPELCIDGICRMSRELSPSQRVCPIGSVLCADLSCRKNYDECAESKYCEKGQIRCVDQTCVNDPSECPSTVSCASNGKYSCPDGRCVSTEVECDNLPLCPEDKPYRCQDNFCAVDQENCLKAVSCGHKMALCSDLLCRASCP